MYHFDLFVFLIVCMDLYHHLILKVTNGLLLANNSGSCALLLLLDFRPAFDTVHHEILIAYGWPAG